MSFSFENVKSLGGNLWKTAVADDRKAELISQRYELPPLIARIIASRGIAPDEVGSFINPKLQNLLPDPSVMKGMAEASRKIAEAVMSGRKIAVIGDYDVDGATSSSVLRLFLESVGVEPIIHIPERDEGYGPSIMAFDKFAAQGVDFVITVDCGTTAFSVFDYAREKGFEIIVLDHHEAEAKLPDVYAVVNPKRLDENNDYPYLKYMAAVGVVFVTMVAVNRELRERGFYQSRPEPNLLEWLDLVALGTVCDVVPLLGLNRAFVRQGLKVMAQRRNIGLRALIDKAAISEAPGAFHLGFVLGPRINACGRVGEAALGNRLLCIKDEFQASLLADKLNEFNDRRKEIEGYVLERAIEMLEGTPQEYPIAFVAGDDWHQGVIGIVAGKLKERYNLPAFVMSIEDDEVKGSARSIPGVDLGALIIAAKEKGVITKGGGHTMAAGFSLEKDRIDDFRRFVGEYVQKEIGHEAITPVIEVDGVLDLAAATVEMAGKLDLLEPYGAGNSEPKLVLPRVRVSRARMVGSGHVSCWLSAAGGGGLKAMAFRVADTAIGPALLNSNGDCFNLVGVLRHDNWQGRNSVQFIIEDVMRVE